jgi:membrane protein
MAVARKPSARSQLRGALQELISRFRQNQLLTWASALSFQVVKAIVPFLLFGFGLIGFLNLDGAWVDIAKSIKPHMSKAAFEVVNDTAKNVLTSKQIWWVTIGFALAMWEVSGGVRTIMGGLNRTYGCQETRGSIERMTRSIGIALVISALILGAIAVAWAGPLLYGDVGQPLGAILFVARWAVAAVLLGSATAITVRMAPDGYQSPEWVSIGTTIVVGCWVVASILFGLYIRYVAAYGSIFGNLATIVILFAYIYLSTIVFFAGAQIDAILRRRVEGNPQGL